MRSIGIVFAWMMVLFVSLSYLILGCIMHHIHNQAVFAQHQAMKQNIVTIMDRNSKERAVMATFEENMPLVGSGISLKAWHAYPNMLRTCVEYPSVFYHQKRCRTMVEDLLDV